METTAFLEMNVYWELHSSLCTRQPPMALPHQKGQRTGALLSAERLWKSAKHQKPWRTRDPGTSIMPWFFRSAEDERETEESARTSWKETNGSEVIVKFYRMKGPKRLLLRASELLNQICLVAFMEQKLPYLRSRWIYAKVLPFSILSFKNLEMHVYKLVTQII